MTLSDCSRLLLLLALGGALASCASPFHWRYSREVRHATLTPKKALLATDGYAVRSNDGSFRLEFGDPVSPPSVYDVKVTQMFATHTLGRTSVFQPKGTDHWLEGEEAKPQGGAFVPEQVKDVGFWDREDVKPHVIPVQLSVKGRAKPLVGKIIFFTVFQEASDSSAKRMWRIQIDPSWVANAEQGFVQTAYQPYAFGGTDFVSWVLSFSSIEF